MDSSDWYTTSLRPDLSQGDIIRVVPTGIIDDPLIACVPSNAEPKGKANYAPVQEVKTGKPKFLHARFSMGLGMVIWPDCQIDKLKNQERPANEWFASVAPVKPLSQLDPQYRDTVVALERAQWFPLPAFPVGLPVDSFVDLRRGWPIRWSLLQDRIVSLSDEARAALGMHLFWFSTELWVKNPLQCPHCKSSLHLSSVFDRKPPEAEPAES